MKTIALTSTVFTLAAASLFGQSQSDIETLRARADAQERKITQLEKELSKLRTYHADEKGAPAASSASAPGSTSAAGTYIVKKGDILTRIAYRHKTSVAAIMKANGLRNDRITIGQKLRIPGAAAAPAASSSGRTEMAQKPAPAPAPSKSVGTHTVKRGETFYSIARQYKISVKSLEAANPRVRPTSMHVGQSLVIDGNARPVASKGPASYTPISKLPASKPKAKAPSKAVAEYVDQPKAKEVVRNAPQDRKTTAAAGSEPAIRTITVHQQMTYGQFASKYGASTTQLNALNGLSLSKNTMLAKGSELYVPQF
ncbi:MAG: LysM peptidoglycan-binding domain-containing protein [Akkermansiaceae bacterium]|nr:LysM peptidoglycan-binding domain-containing protein [Akkermansiaceae bacterium]